MPALSAVRPATRWQARGLIALLGLCGIPAAVEAQQPDTTKAKELPDLTVTAPAPQRVIAPPSSVITVDSSTLHRTQASNAYDLVRRTTGIEIHEQGQGPGYASNAVLRGFTSDHSSDVLLVLDGVPINLPIHGHVEGYADWSALSAPALQSLRVIQGPASPEYGDFAFGGVVEAATAVDGHGTATGFSGTSEGDAGAWVRLGARRSDGGEFLSVEARRGEGWRDNSQSWLGTAVMRGWRKAGSGRLEGGLLLYGSSWDSPGFVSVARFNDDDVTTALDKTDGGDAERMILHGRYTKPVGEDGNLQLLGWSQVVRQSVYLTIPDDGILAQSREHDRRVAFGGQFQVTRPLAGGSFTAGLDSRIDFARYDRLATEERRPGDPETSNRGQFAAAGSFMRWRRLFGEHLQFDLGARADVLAYGSYDLLSDAPTWERDTHVELSPKAGARWLFNNGVSLFGSFSHGFRGPPGVITDPSLPMVDVWSKELGVALHRERISAGLSAFHMAVAHDQVLNPVTLEISAQGRSVRQGLSGSLEAGLTPKLWIVGEAVLNDATIRGPTDSTGSSLRLASLADADTAVVYTGGQFKHEVPPEPGDPVPGVSRYTAKTGIEYRGQGQDIVGAYARFVGPYAPLGEPDVRTQSYVLLDLSATVGIPALHADLDVDLLNLLDRRYPEIRATGYVNPGAPRAVRVAMRFPMSR